MRASNVRHLDCDPRAIHLVRNGGAYSAYRDDDFVDNCR